jgi:hypothetical protein
MIARMKDLLRATVSPRTYRRFLRIAAVLGAVASIYAFVTLDLFANAIAPQSGRLTPTFSTSPAKGTATFGFANKTDIRVDDLNAAFGLYGEDGLLIYRDTFAPAGMTVDAGIEKEGDESLAKIGADLAAVYLFCAEHKADFPMARVREVYLLVPSRFDQANDWRQAHYLHEVWRFDDPDCRPPEVLPDPWLAAARGATQ